MRVNPLKQMYTVRWKSLTVTLPATSYMNAASQMMRDTYAGIGDSIVVHRPGRGVAVHFKVTQRQDGSQAVENVGIV